jgi:Right handed beta helix region
MLVVRLRARPLQSKSRFIATLASVSLLLPVACEPNDGSAARGEFAPTISLHAGPEACSGDEIAPPIDLASEVTNNPEATTFCLASGIYRISQPLTLKPGQRLIGAGVGKTIISGAKMVSATKEGTYWVITGQTSLGQSAFSGTTGQCRPVQGRDPKGMCVYRDQVFLDDRSRWQVGSIAELSSGEFFWDYATNRIYLADDPTGMKLEVSVAGNGISGGAGVQIWNLTVEKFGNEAQTGAISASGGWLIEGVEVRLNHGAGIHMGPGTIVRGSFIHHNGQLGIHGGQPSCAGAKGLVLENSELSYNNAAGYNWGWEGGAAKWTNTDGLVVRNNIVHHNYGMGLWTDGFNINVLYAGNVVRDNDGMGIDHELGYAAVIRDNVVTGNGFQHPVKGDAWGAGIFIDQSRDVQIYDNTVEDNAAGITAVQEPAGDPCGYGIAAVANLSVHDNTVRQLTGIAAGLRLLNESDQTYYTSKNNRWANNHYTLGDSADGLYFYWTNEPIGAAEWRSLGHG